MDLQINTATTEVSCDQVCDAHLASGRVRVVYTTKEEVKIWRDRVATDMKRLGLTNLIIESELGSPHLIQTWERG